MFVLPGGMFGEALGYHIGHRMRTHIKLQKKGLCLELHDQHAYLQVSVTFSTLADSRFVARKSVAKKGLKLQTCWLTLVSCLTIQCFKMLLCSESVKLSRHIFFAFYTIFVLLLLKFQFWSHTLTIMHTCIIHP